MPHPHGTINRYNNQRCRCDACREAMRDYKRALRARGKAAPAVSRASSTSSAERPATAPAASAQLRATPAPAPAPRPVLAVEATPRAVLEALEADQLDHLTIGSVVVWSCGHVDNWRAWSRTAPPCSACGAEGVIASTVPTPYADIPVITPGAPAVPAR